MTRYTLPDGTVAPACERDNAALPGLGSWIDHPTYGVILVGADKLTLVQPPLPEPTQDGTIVAVESEGVKTWVFSRREAVYRSMYPSSAELDCWWWHDHGGWITWRLICDMGTPVVHRPDPAADGPTLRAEGFAEAVAMLRDDDRYADWWTKLPQQDPAYGYWERPARRHLADYLETVKTPLPAAEARATRDTQETR